MRQYIMRKRLETHVKYVTLENGKISEEKSAIIPDGITNQARLLPRVQRESGIDNILIVSSNIESKMYRMPTDQFYELAEQVEADSVNMNETETETEE